MFKKVLVTIDRSKLSEAVLPHLQKLLSACPAEVSLLTVVRSPRATRRSGADQSRVTHFASGDVAAVERVPPAYVETRGQAIQRTEHELLQRLEALSGPIRETGSQVRTVVRAGEPEQVIVDFAREGSYDLIVMATHGRSGLSELVQGSIAAAVVKSGVAPVLLVRPGKQ
ncbi:MAG: hypothetical protein A2Y74_06220 [Actinobacteria bacterium RBG_13_63_9]|nr:MAG: hypothetical protein A2Y74_06220 [Actinobacteria bacterium RBG_13_63_9]